jgi:lipoprotein-anchoring transpeptidase ErfK/SrfK
MRATLLVLLFLARATHGLALEEDSLRKVVAHEQGMIDLLMECMADTYHGHDLSDDLLYVSVSRQRLIHVRNGKVRATYPVSTALRGIGSLRESLCTPQGLHRIKEKLGEGAPAWGIFQERTFTGALADTTAAANKDLITSRILWLDGLEPGVNQGGQVDSRDRHIYIHGTADEGPIGTPASQGCVRMRNADIIQLFAQVSSGALVLILP